MNEIESICVRSTRANREAIEEWDQGKNGQSQKSIWARDRLKQDEYTMKNKRINKMK